MASGEPLLGGDEEAGGDPLGTLRAEQAQRWQAGQSSSPPRAQGGGPFGGAGIPWTPPRLEEEEWVSGVSNNVFRGAGCCCLGFLIPFFLVQFAFAAIPPNHVGIQFNTFSKHVDKTQLLEAGRHFTGPFLTYITFPLNIQNVQMELESRTSEGYPLTLKVEFQYQLIRDEILDLYEHYTVKYAPVFQRNVRAALMKSVSDYDASDLFMKRKAIMDDMQFRIDKILRELHARCWGVQFDDVQQPAAFENTLLQTELQRWYAQTKIAEQHISAIQANTSVLEAEFDKNISVVNSTATAECKYIISQAEASGRNYENEAQANATLLTDRASAYSSQCLREAKATSELKYQEAVARGNRDVLSETAEANMREVRLQGLQLSYWKTMMGLSDRALIQFQRLLGSYRQLEDVKFLFGFENTYATAEASPGAAAAGDSAQNLARVAVEGSAFASVSTLGVAPPQAARRLAEEQPALGFEFPPVEL